MFDANGVETLQESYNHVAPGGKLVVYGMLKVVYLSRLVCMVLVCSGKD